MYIWTIEIWNPKKEAGIDNKEWIHWFRDHPIEDDLKVFEWAQRIAPADSQSGHVDWKPFDHPQLGKVELGGWNRMAVFTNPPPALREKEIARFPKWLLWQTLISPKLELREVQRHGRRHRYLARAPRRAEHRLVAELRQQDGGQAQSAARRAGRDRAARRRPARERQVARGTRRTRRLGLPAHRHFVLAQQERDRRPHARRLGRAWQGRHRGQARGLARSRRTRRRPASRWADRFAAGTGPPGSRCLYSIA